MGDRNKTEVLIIGAGPVGLFAAVLLRERGVGVEVLDAARDTAGHSYAIALHPSSLEILEEAGLADALLEGGHRIERVVFYDDQRERAAVALGELSAKYPYALVVPQNAFESALEQRLRDRGSQVRWNHRAARLRDDGERVAVEVDVLEKDSVGYAVAGTEWVVAKQRKYAVPFVVGADGHESIVRRQLGIEHEGAGPHQAYRVFEFEGDAAEIGHDVRVVLGERGSGVLWPLPGGLWRWSFETDDRPDLGPDRRYKSRLAVDPRSYGDPALREQLVRLISERAPWFEATVGQVHWSTVVPFQPRVAARLGIGRQWLVGDAAHVAGPVGVHSMNIGLREARDLAARLHGILRGELPLAEMATYERERLQEWRRLRGEIVATGEVDPWIEERRAQILACLPAGGAELDQLAAMLGLRFADPA